MAFRPILSAPLKTRLRAIISSAIGRVGVSTPGAPTVTKAPSLSSSTPVVGTALTATPGTYGGVPAPTITRQWFYADTGAPISGATSLSYTPVSADVGHPIKYVETATNTAGSIASAAPTTGAVGGAGVPASLADGGGNVLTDGISNTLTAS